MKHKKFKNIIENKYSDNDLKSIETTSEQKKSNIFLGIRISSEKKVWLENTLNYLNRKSSKKISKTDIVFLALSNLQKKKEEEILKDYRLL